MKNYSQLKYYEKISKELMGASSIPICKASTRHFSFRNFKRTAAYDSLFRCSSTARLKSLMHRTAKESLSLHCRDTFAFCQRWLNFWFIVPVPPVASFQSFVPHSIPSATSGTPHKSNSFSSLCSPCYSSRPQPFRSVLTLAFSCAQWNSLVMLIDLLIKVF
jgi:hypothetical protein